MDRQDHTESPPPVFMEDDASRMSGSTRQGPDDRGPIPPPDFQQFTEKDFPLAGEIPIPHVSPLTAHFHLSILRRFCALYDVVESTGGNTAEEKARALQIFLVCAEARYVRYLSLLETFAKAIRKPYAEGVHDFSKTMPLPPWDVAIMFHSHNLSPFRFYADMMCRDRVEALWAKGIAFPLERLHHLITNGTWSDPDSEKLWNKRYPNIPYQVWNTDPTSTTSAALTLQNIEMACPWCEKVGTIDLASFRAMHVTKTSKCRFSSCHHEFTADSLSAKYFKDDMIHYVKTGDAWRVKGVHLDSDGTNRSDQDVSSDLRLILDTGAIAFSPSYKRKRLAYGTDLSNYIFNTQQYLGNGEASWKGLVTSFRETINELKAAKKFKDINRRNIFARLRIGYMGLVYHELSIDLVAAALRQREFARKITATECAGMDSPFALFKATTRYHKFMLLMRRQGTKQTNLVPTLDIDLCWHTHQLFPRPYREWCLQHLGRAVNHDDTIGTASLSQGLRDTSLAWLGAYREAYTTDDLKKSYFSTGRKVAGIIFPPYGLHMLSKGRKLEQARTVVGNDANRPRDRNGNFYNDDAYLYSYMYMYPYWTMYPYGWYYPAACGAGYAGVGGWGAGVGGSGIGACGNGETSACGSGACGGASGACASAAGGSCGGGGCGGGGGSGGGCGGGGCGGGGGGCGGGS